MFDDEVPGFEACLDLLSQMGRFVDTPTAVAAIRGDIAITETLYHLSFDDGYRNIISNALPVLHRLGVPAIFFVPTAQIGNPAGTKGEGSARIELATWDELESAQAKGLQIGSHTRTHARLSEISNSIAAIEDEILGSKADIEERLGPCPYISWPYGRARDTDAAALAVVQQAGYDACFGAFRAQVMPGKTDLFRIPRHHFESGWPLSHLRYFARGGMEGRHT